MALSRLSAQTEDARPYAESLAQSTAVTSSSKRVTVTTGPNTSRWLSAAGEQGRLVIKIRAGMHGGAGDALDMRLTKGALDETGLSVALARTDQRADRVVRVRLAGNAQVAHGITQLRG